MSKKGTTAIACHNGLFFLLKSIRSWTLFRSYYNKIFLLIAYLTYGLLFILVRKNHVILHLSLHLVPIQNKIKLVIFLNPN